MQSLLLAGVKGYVLKRAAADDLIRAVRAVAAGGVYLDPSVAEQALPTSTADRASSRAGSEELSPREEAVLKFTAQGFSNKEIAGRLEISIKSVETYKARAALKFDLRSRADIVRYGVSRGWLVRDQHRVTAYANVSVGKAPSGFFPTCAKRVLVQNVGSRNRCRCSVWRTPQIHFQPRMPLTSSTSNWSWRSTGSGWTTRAFR